MKIEDKKQELDALMITYSKLKGDPSNIGRCSAIKTQVASILYAPDFHNLLKAKAQRVIGKQTTGYDAEDFINETFLKYFDQYDHNRNNSFYAFFSNYLQYAIRNLHRKEHPERDGVLIDDEGNETPFTEAAEDSGLNLESMVDIRMLFQEEISEDEAESRQKFMRYFSKLIPCVIQSKEHRGNREQYYRSFASDFYISFSKCGLHLRYDINENDALAAMDLGFADFTLSAKCRSFAQFKDTSCKTYVEIGVTGGENAFREIETPFRNGVYKAYFGVTDGAISQQRSRFHNDIGLMVNKEREE